MLGLAAASGRWKLPSGRDLAALVLLGVLNNAL
ncbi:EamA family transporter, partial [Methylobacterium radiotolerans]